tara:strand:+ start:762 stop:2015 length:1254 start_codon:yes stop_codon:yes gene_type:complete
MIFCAFERMIAMRYLRSRRRDGFVSIIAGFSLIGIALGVATLIIVMSVMNGFRAELLNRILGLNGHIGISAALDRGLEDFDKIAKNIQNIPGVSRVTPIIEGQAMATVRGEAAGVLIRGIRAKDLKKHKILVDNIENGSVNNLYKGGAAIVGTRFAARYGLQIGDAFSLVAPTGRQTAFGTLPRIKRFFVAATFEIGMFEYDSRFIYIPLNTARKFFNYQPGTVSTLEVMLNDPDKIAAKSLAIKKVSDIQLRLLDWQNANSGFFNAIQVERNVMFLILTLIIVVAAFNIISGLIMLVKDKGRDIAILRTIGATKGAVTRVFLLSGMSVGLIGTATGSVIGLVFALNIETIRQLIEKLSGSEIFAAEIYFLSKLPAKVDAGEVAMVIALALGLSFLATIYPAWRAAKLDPVMALRYE